MAKKAKSKRPAEVFGYPIDVTSGDAKAARSSHCCRFEDEKCSKKSRLISYPMGVCSVQFGKDVIALCPGRFLQDGTVFKDIANHAFGTVNNILPFEEVSIPHAGALGRFDYVLAKHKPLSSKIDDFAVIEFQTGQTTSTGKLVDALKTFMAGGDIEDSSYGFGLNLADIWKRTFTQILTKGIVMERWDHKVYWVVQEPVYQNLVTRYKLQGMGYDPNHHTLFAVYDIRREGDEFVLYQTRIESCTVDFLFDAFQHNLSIPSASEFIAKLEKKAQEKATADLQLKLKLV